MRTLIVCKEIRRVAGGWIVEARWPFGEEPAGYGEVVCRSWAEVVNLLTRATTTDGDGDLLRSVAPSRPDSAAVPARSPYETT